MNIILLPTEAFDNTKQQAVINESWQYRHACEVLGVQVGDVIKIGKFGDKLGTAVVASIGEQKIMLEQVMLDTSPPAKLGVTLILALPRPKVLRRLIMDMTAMGVSKIVLMNSYRTDKSYWQSPLLARLDEFVCEGLQQAVDTVPPKIELAKRFKPFVQDKLPTMMAGSDAVVLHPYSERSFGQIMADTPPKTVIIGAEGGFIEYEIELLQSVGVVSATLGSRILRTESAVNAVLGRYLL